MRRAKRPTRLRRTLEIGANVKATVGVPTDGKVVGIRHRAILLHNVKVVAHEKGVGLGGGKGGREGLLDGAVVSKGMRHSLLGDSLNGHEAHGSVAHRLGDFHTKEGADDD
jgi:hypothetical protein